MIRYARVRIPWRWLKKRHPCPKGNLPLLVPMLGLKWQDKGWIVLTRTSKPKSPKAGEVDTQHPKRQGEDIEALEAKRRKEAEQ